jgi:hypothetical protein
MSPLASPVAKQAVRRAVERVRQSGAASVTPPKLLDMATDAAWDVGLMLSTSDIWMAVYEWGGFTQDDPPPDDLAMSLGHEEL